MFILRHQPDLPRHVHYITSLLSHFLKLSFQEICLTFTPSFAFVAGYERLARARLGLPEVDDVSEDPKYNQTPSSVLEIDQPSSVLEMELGPSTANISTATAATNDDDSNLDMFGDDDSDDANHSSDANTVGSGLHPGTSDVKSKFTSLALFSPFCGNLLHISPSFWQLLCFLYSQIFVPSSCRSR